MRLSCPAKINLHLRVGRRRAADGFHPLLTWMATVGLFDTLTVEAITAAAALPPTGAGTAAAAGPASPATAPGPAGGQHSRAARTEATAGMPADEHPTGGHPTGASTAAAAAAPRGGPPPGRERAGATSGDRPARVLRLSGDLPGLPCDETNLVVRAAAAFAAAIEGGPGAWERNTGAVLLEPREGGRADAGSGAEPRAASAATSGGAAVAGNATGEARRQRPRADEAGGGGTGEGVGAAAGDDETRPARGEGEVTRAGALVGPLGGPSVAPLAEPRVGARVRPVEAVLAKRIPLGAGLGGGSSDAARTLMGVKK